MSLNIELAKLKFFSPKETFDWLEKDYRNKKLSYKDNKIIEKDLYEKEDELINLGLVLYGFTNIVDEIYINTSNENIKLAYLSSRQLLDGDIVDLVESYQKLSKKVVNSLFKEAIENIDNKEHVISNEPTKDELELKKCRERLSTLFANESIDDKILVNLYSKKEYYSNLDENIWMELISFTSKNKRLTLSYSNIHGDYLCPWSESSYNDVFKSFFKLFETIEVNEENAQILLNILENGLLHQEVYNFDTKKCLDRWKVENDDNTCYFYIRYYLSKYFFNNQEIKKLKNSEDLAERKAFYNSYYVIDISEKEMEKAKNIQNEIQSLSDSILIPEIYFKELEKFYDKDGEDFVNEILHNKYLYMTKDKRDALSQLVSLSEEKSSRFGFDFLNTYNQQYQINLNENPQWFEDSEDEFFDSIDEIDDKNIKQQKMIEAIYNNVKLKENSQLQNQFDSIENKLENLFSKNYYENIKFIINEKLSSVSSFKWLFIGLIIGVALRSFF